MDRALFTTVLLFLAVLCFLLAVFHANVGVDLTNLGLALGFGALIPVHIRRSAP